MYCKINQSSILEAKGIGWNVFTIDVRFFNNTKAASSMKTSMLLHTIPV